jgi:hypothetical protein
MRLRPHGKGTSELSCSATFQLPDERSVASYAMPEETARRRANPSGQYRCQHGVREYRPETWSMQAPPKLGPYVGLTGRMSKVGRHPARCVVRW